MTKEHGRGECNYDERSLPEKHRGVEIRNHRATRLKKAPKGMDPDDPVWWMSTFSTESMSKEMPGK